MKLLRPRSFSVAEGHSDRFRNASLESGSFSVLWSTTGLLSEA